jgi:hypothetical protein
MGTRTTPGNPKSTSPPRSTWPALFPPYIYVPSVARHQSDQSARLRVFFSLRNLENNTILLEWQRRTDDGRRK